MPVIKLLNSIKILMYFNDHIPPHFHAQYGEYEALIVIETLEIYAGYLPAKQHKKVIEWAAQHQAFLIAKWNEFNQRNN